MSFEGFEGYTTTGHTVHSMFQAGFWATLKGLVGHFCSAAELYVHTHHIAKSDALQ